MAIIVSRSGDMWRAEVTPPDAIAAELGPLSLHELIVVLAAAGCHSTDVSDAVFAADRAEWQRLYDPDRKFERFYKDL